MPERLVRQMSRSYKKFPLFRDNLWCGRSSGINGKTYSNRKIRRKLRDVTIDVGNGKDYRRFGLDSWDLWEYKSYETKQDAIDRWELEQAEIANGIDSWRSKHNITLEQALIYWKMSYKVK